MTDLNPSSPQPGFLKRAFDQAKILGGTLLPVAPTLYATLAAGMSVPDVSVINGLVMGVSFCASVAATNRAHFPSLRKAYEYYSDRNYDSYGAAAMMAVFYTEISLLNRFMPLWHNS